MDDGKKKITIIAVCSLLLIAMVVALVIMGQEDKGEEAKDLSGSQKAITAICQTTDYQKTCMDSLHGQNSTDPKELIEVAFQAAINYLNASIGNSTTLKELQKDPKAKAALDTCGELANRAINDLHRSYSKFTSFDITNVDDVLLDLKTWLSGAMTNQETCLDGFDEVWGDAGLKMKDILTTSMQMTSNALAMVAEIATFLDSMGLQGVQSRRLLSDDLGHGGEVPYWMDSERRELAVVRPQKIKPNAIVAKDGSGTHRTIDEALRYLPKNSNKTIVLYIKEGVYKEQVKINSTLKHLMMIGDGPTKTRITGSLNFIDGTGTYQTATVAVQGDDFIARDIGFENSAGAEKHQAVALRVSADKSIFFNCHMDGYQDTLYVHTYRQFYRDCVISGTIDFIFGDSAAVFQGCTLLVRKPLSNQQNIVTAQGRKDVRQPTGLVLQNCTFKADPELYPIRHNVKSYLGRPWKEFSRTIIMESFLDDLIHPDGWLPWNGTFALETLFYTEFNNRGPASPKAQRVKWAGVKELPSNRIERFTAAKFLDGNRWIPPTRVPYAAGFIFPVPKQDPNVKYSPVVPEENKDLGSNMSIDKSAFSYASKNDSTTTPPSSSSTPRLPSPPPPSDPSQTTNPVTESNIASPPMSIFPHDSAASPSSFDSTEGEITEVIIDLSPIVAPAPSPTSVFDVPSSAPMSFTADSSVSPSLSSSAGQTSMAPSPSSSPDLAATTPSLSPSDSSASPPQTDLAATPSISPSGSSASPPQTDLAAASSLSPSDSPASLPQTNLASTPTLSPSGNSASPPQADLATTPSLSPSDSSASPPQVDLAATPSITPSDNSASPPQEEVTDSDTNASPPTTTSGSSAPESSIPLAGAPSTSFTA